MIDLIEEGYIQFVELRGVPAEVDVSFLGQGEVVRVENEGKGT